MKPIRIYLDTSDYIRLLSPEPNTRIASVKNYLLASVNDGTIEIGYSYWIITEFIKAGDARHKSDRQAKGKLINDLTKGNAFPHPIDLKKGRKFPNDGIWLPRDTLGQFGATQIIEAMKENLVDEKRLNRAWRRKLGTLSGTRELFREFGSTQKLTRQHYYPIPVTDEFLENRYLERFLTGEISQREFQTNFLRWTSNPEQYYELFYQYLELDDPLEKALEEFHQKFLPSLLKLIKYIQDVKLAEKVAKKAYREYRAIVRESDLPPAMRAVLPALEKPNVEPVPIIKVSEMFLKIFPVGQTAYIDEYFSALMEGRKPKASDLIDIMHLQYIYYCDLFRCDLANSKLFSGSPSLPSSKIVDRLEALPSRIQELVG